MTDGFEQAPSRRQIQRWRRYLADERAEAAVYRELARRREGAEREILLRIAAAENRHEEYWRDRLGDEVGMPLPPSLRTRLIGFLARRFGSVFVLALMQNAETRNPYASDKDASQRIAADETIHAEVVRALAARGREEISGGFRAAIFGANDGLVSNFALVLGMVGTGVSARVVLLTGISGLLAGALSMAAGEFISVKSQRELLDAARPPQETSRVLPLLDVNENELALVFRARGLAEEEAQEKARATLDLARGEREEYLAEEAQGSPAKDGSGVAALSSFCCFSVGAALPVLPFAFGASTSTGAIIALVLVSVALLLTGGITGVFSGKRPEVRALRQLAVGLGSAAVTWLLGLVFGGLLG